jgi:glucokinase
VRTVLAADLGGTKCAFAIVDAAERVHGLRQARTPREREPLLAAIASELGGLRNAVPPDLEPPGAVGIGTAGVVRADQSTIEYAPNLAFDGFDLGGHVRAEFGLPCSVINDGRASAVGEWKRGELAGRDPMLVLFFGTGIGIGLIAGGRPYGGADNAAGEIGHTIHVPGGRRCVCGRLGCYEAYCGGRPIGMRALAELGAPPAGGAWDVAMLRAVGREDPRAAAILADAETAAGALVASACTLLNPAAVVLGGGVLGAWPELFESIETTTRRWCAPIVTRGLRFARSRLGSGAILVGAAAATGHLW